MDNSVPSDAERKELRGLVERIKRGECVLVLGPRVAIRPNDPDRRPLDELLASELLAGIGLQEDERNAGRTSLRRAADLHYQRRHDREELELAVQEFYARETETTDLHRNLAQMPFTLCISTSPDSLMSKAFEEAGKSPRTGYYRFGKTTNASLAEPTPDKPLVYHLYGHHEDPSSLVLTESDLIEFLVSIVRGTPPLPDQVRSILAQSAVSFLFLGFGFHNWYLRVLLQVMNVYGHRSKGIAFEDTQFFDHPDRDQVVGFFSGDRLIDFRPLRWEAFAQHLREAYGAGAAPKTTPTRPGAESPSSVAPRAFLSYASEDREAVEALAEQLEARGVRVWQDKQDLRAGDDWNRVLLGVIATRVDYVVVVQTPVMTTQIEGVFHREIGAALQRQKDMGEFEGQQFRFLVPVRVGACPLLSSLSAYHVIDVGEANGLELLVKSILEDWARRAALKSLGQEAA